MTSRLGDEYRPLLGVVLGLALAGAGAACDQAQKGAGGGLDGGDGGGLPSGADANTSLVVDARTGSCNIEISAPATEGGQHVPLCTTIDYATKPPSSGKHYATDWAIFRAYTQPVPWGFLVHAMEHGAVVIAYNCPEGCAAELDDIGLLLNAVPKKACGRPPVIVTPDPTLDVKFAAASWGHILRGGCFDLAVFTRFVTDHMNLGPENFPNDCGAADREAAGWCPDGIVPP